MAAPLRQLADVLETTTDEVCAARDAGREPAGAAARIAATRRPPSGAGGEVPVPAERADQP